MENNKRGLTINDGFNFGLGVMFAKVIVYGVLIIIGLIIFYIISNYNITY